MATSQLMLVLIAGLPLAAALLAYALAWAAPQRAQRLSPLLSLGSLLGSAAAAGLLLAQKQAAAISLAWLKIPDSPLQSIVPAEVLLQGPHSALASTFSIDIPFALLATARGLTFALTTALIGAGVVLFALRERRDDPRKAQFLATLTLFAGAMLLLLTADTLLLVYIAWELMGLCSYLLIAHKGTPAALRAARQAFWTTRTTDFGLLIAVLIVSYMYKLPTVSSLVSGFVHAGSETLRIPDLPSPGLATWIEQLQGAPMEAQFAGMLSFAAVLALLAAFGKAAQFPLSFWIADAMEAPSPVSALLHAATMVAAGPWLLIILAPLYCGFGPDGELLYRNALFCNLALYGGALSAILCGVLALFAREPKRLLAYSTASQLGIVIAGCGALAFDGAFMHLMAHAWFKASLFLAVGFLLARLHAMRPEVHVPLLSDLASVVPAGLLRPALWLAGLSLAGLWPLAGALGKEGIISAAGFGPAGMLLLAASILSAAYSFKLLASLLLQPASAPAPEGVASDSAAGQSVDQSWQPALLVIAGLAVMGSLGLSALNAKLILPQNFVMLALSLLALAAGGFIGMRYFSAAAAAAAAPSRGLVCFLENGMYLREFFNELIGSTGEFIALIFAFGDVSVVDWLATRSGVLGRRLSGIFAWFDIHIVDGARWRVCEITWIIRHWHSRLLQTGSIQHYMLIVLISAVALCLVVLRELSNIFGELLRRV